MVLLRRVRVFGLIAALVAVLAIGGAAPASANCDNVSLCGANLFGFWAWAVFNADGTVQGEVTNCGHLTKAGAPGLAGAQHFHIDGHWTIVNFGPNNPWIVN